MSECSQCSKLRKFLSLLVNSFPLVRKLRVNKKIRHKKLKMKKSIEEKPKQLGRYVIQSGTIRRL